VEGARTAVDSNQKCLGRDLNRSGWPSPVANDRYAAHGKDTPSGGFMGGLRDVVQKTHWPTPNVGDSHPRSLNTWKIPKTGQVNAQQLATASGAIANGSPAAMEKPAQLNPELSRWLMGYPPAWSSCADTATR
jgi:hypothetical protein